MKTCCEQHNQADNQENKKSTGGLIFILIGVAVVIAAAVIIYKGGANSSPAPASPTSTSDQNAAQDADPLAAHHRIVSGPSGDFSNLIGKPAPAFSLIDDKGALYTQENLRGKAVVLFFNEGLMCYPACWNQIASFPKDPRFKDAIVLSVVVDPPQEWRRATEQMPDLAAATVVFDTSAAVSNAFGVLSLPSSMHKGSLPGHTYVLIDKEGIVHDAFDDPAMALNNDRLAQALTNL